MINSNGFTNTKPLRVKILKNQSITAQTNKQNENVAMANLKSTIIAPMAGNSCGKWKGEATWKATANGIATTVLSNQSNLHCDSCVILNL